MTSPQELDQWLQEPETDQLEFIEAKNGIDERELMEHCAAIANENGGKLILGVAPPRIVGTNAFTGTLEKLQHELLQQLQLRVEVEEMTHPNGRVLIFHVPRHQICSPVKYQGRFWMRVGPIKKVMDDATLKKIYAEIEEDFSAQIVVGLSINDLDAKAVTVLKRRRAEKTGNPTLAEAPTEQLLHDMQLVTDAGCTYACLILLGKAEKIAALLPQAEIIYEWRSTSTQTHHDFRMSWKSPYFAIYDEIWNTINARNLRAPYHEGFVQHEIPAFDEQSCREAVNNAVAHRDYRTQGASIFLRASPAALIVESPGGFLAGITSENALRESRWRNRLVAEAFERTQLVERSGQGLDRIFEASIRQGKGLPSFEGTNQHRVQLNIPATIQDTDFVRFLEKVANERQIIFSVDELLELESIRSSGKVLSPMFRTKFLELGLIEQHGKTRGARYILAHRYYAMTDHRGVHTRLAGLSRDAKKMLILQHLQKNTRGTLGEFAQTFPEMSKENLSMLLWELRKREQIRFVGSKRNGYWEIVAKNHKIEE